MATPKVEEQPKVESQPAPQPALQPETAPASASPETPEQPEVQASTPGPEQGQDPRPGDGQGDGQDPRPGDGQGDGQDPRPGDGQGDGQDPRPGDDQGDGPWPSPSKAVSGRRADAAEAADDTLVSSTSTALVKDEQGGDAEDDPYSEMRDGMGGGITGWAGQGGEQDAGNQEATVQLEDGDVEMDESESSFDAVASGGGIGAGLLGLSAAHYEDESRPGEYQADDSHEAPRPANRRSRRPQPIQDDDAERAHNAAVELGRRGGLKSGAARRSRSLKIKPPRMQQVSDPEPAKRRKRPYWFKPPRLPGQRA